MTAFSNSFGRFGSIRKRDANKKNVQPIDVAAAKQYDQAGPSSAASSSLLTPRPHHFRSTTPSPAFSAASTFASSSSSSSSSSWSAPSSARTVSSPTFVSSSAFSPSTSAFHGDFETMSPPLSPDQLNSTVVRQATKSPLRRALSRTLFFGSSHSSAPAHAQPAPSHISSPIPGTWDAATSHAPRPVRPARPATSIELSPQPDAFGLSASAMTRSQTGDAVMVNSSVDVTPRRRSRTLLPPLNLAENRVSKPTCTQLSSSSSWSKRSSRTPSPVPIAHAGSSAPAASASSQLSPRASLRSIRQMHTRRSIQSIFGFSTTTVSSVTPESEAPSRLAPRRRLTRCASEESFHCRGPGFDAPPAADPRPSVDEDPINLRLMRSRSATSVPRCVSVSSCSYSESIQSSGARRMSSFTIESYREAADTSMDAAHDILRELQVEAQNEDEHESQQRLTGLGLSEPLPAAPRVIPRSLSTTSQISLAESVPSSIDSSSSTVSLSSVENLLDSTTSWPGVPKAQHCFSACPPTPPSSIRLELAFRSLPTPSPALLASSLSEGEFEAEPKKPRPLSGIFVSSNSSVLDLKETIVGRMLEAGYRLSPKNLTLMLHLNEDIRTGPETALGLHLSMYGPTPAKVLDDGSRLLFEEGAQEHDLVVVDCDPSQFLWRI